MLLKMVENDDKIHFSIIAEESGLTVQAILFQTRTMRKFAETYGSVLYIDDAYCVDNVSFPIYVFVGADGDKQKQFVGYAIAQNETTRTLSRVVTEFVTKNPSAPFNSVVVVKDAAEIKAAQDAIPDVAVLLCHFHVTKNFRDAVANYCKNVSFSVRDRAKNNMSRMLYMDCEEEFEAAMSELPTQLEHYVAKN